MEARIAGRPRPTVAPWLLDEARQQGASGNTIHSPNDPASSCAGIVPEALETPRPTRRRTAYYVEDSFSEGSPDSISTDAPSDQMAEASSQDTAWYEETSPCRPEGLTGTSATLCPAQDTTAPAMFTAQSEDPVKSAIDFGFAVQAGPGPASRTAGGRGACAIGHRWRGTGVTRLQAHAGNTSVSASSANRRRHAMLGENRTSMANIPAFKEKAAPKAKKRGSMSGMTALGTTTGGHNGGRMAGMQALPLAPLKHGTRGRTYKLGLHRGGNLSMRPGEKAFRSSQVQAPARPTLEHGLIWAQNWTTSQARGAQAEPTSRSRWGRRHRRSAPKMSTMTGAVKSQGAGGATTPEQAEGTRLSAPSDSLEEPTQAEGTRVSAPSDSFGEMVEGKPDMDTGAAQDDGSHTAGRRSEELKPAAVSRLLDVQAAQRAVDACTFPSPLPGARGGPEEWNQLPIEHVNKRLLRWWNQHPRAGEGTPSPANLLRAFLATRPGAEGVSLFDLVRGPEGSCSWVLTDSR